MHLWVKVGDESIPGSGRGVRRNYNLEFLKRTLPGWTELSYSVALPVRPKMSVTSSLEDGKTKAISPSLPRRPRPDPLGIVGWRGDRLVAV
jgi:hypothetical protein